MTREDLREYALDYYQHVQAFPTYLAAFALRLNEGELRRAVLANMIDEQGGEEGKEESDTRMCGWILRKAWARPASFGHKAVPEVNQLVKRFTMWPQWQPEEALAAFYAYESQVPRVAKEKDRGLRERVRRRRAHDRLFHFAHDRRHLPLECLEGAACQAGRGESRKGRSRKPWQRRRRRPKPVDGAGWNPEAANSEGGIRALSSRKGLKSH